MDMEIHVPTLPSDCLREIFPYVPFRQRIQLRKVCKQWRNVVDENCWKIRELHVYYTNASNERIGRKIVRRTFSHEVGRKVYLWTNSAVFVNNLIGLCGHFLTRFTEIRRPPGPNISKNIWDCQNLRQLKVTVNAPIDDKRLCDLFRITKNIKCLDLEFGINGSYECLHFIQANILEELKISKSFRDGYEHEMVICKEKLINRAHALKRYSCDEMSLQEFYAVCKKVNLETLVLNQDGFFNQLHDLHLTPVFNLKNLKLIRFSVKRRECSDDIITGIAANCQKLEDVSITGTDFITDRSMAFLSQLPCLKTLHIGPAHFITDEFLWQFCDIEYLSVENCRRIFDVGVIQLLQRSQTIKYLALRGTSVTPEIITVANETVENRVNRIPLTLMVDSQIIAASNLIYKSPLLDVKFE